MTTMEKTRHGLAVTIARALGGNVTVSPEELIRPPQDDMGDLSFACFGAAKQLKKSPAAIAKELEESIILPDFVSKVHAVGPYLNATLERRSFGTAVMREVEEAGLDYGTADPQDGGHVMVEYGSPNTHKEIHVGHLRNFALGLAVERLLRAAGREVVAVNYIGDIGTHVAKWLWYYDKVRTGQVEGVARIGDEDIRAFGKIYTDATRLAEQDPEKSGPEISAVLQALERHEPEWEQLWIKTRDACLAAMDRIFEELGIRFERTYLESEVEHMGKALVMALAEKGIAKEGERGALIVDLEQPEGLGIFLVLKSDGTALYSTKELALAEKKFAEYPDIAESIHIVDNRQSLYFRQLIATLRRMGFDKPMRHLGYELVTLKEGGMSSRRGNIVTYEDFRDEMITMVADNTRKRHAEWSDAKIGETAWTVAEGAMKFWMLKQDNDRPLVFDMQAAASTDGFTGPYVQYCYTRLTSILAKAGNEYVPGTFAPGTGADEERDSGGDAGKYVPVSNDASEFALLRAVADFPSVVAEAARDYRPSVMAQYLFELAQSANAFYRDVPVLSAGEDDRKRRLAIVGAARITLANGLKLLGIRVTEEM